MNKPSVLVVPRAFTLLELLSVIAIVVILAVVSGPSISALKGAGDVNKAASDLSGLLELARTHALTHQTFGRVAIADVPPGGSQVAGAVIVLPLASTDGTLLKDSGSAMADSAHWRALSRPLVLSSFTMRDALNADNPDTSSDSVPSASDLDGGDVLRLNVPGFGMTEFPAVLQFDSRGQVSVFKESPARHVKITLDRREAAGGRNPMVIRISGNHGSIDVLRTDQGVR